MSPNWVEEELDSMTLTLVAVAVTLASMAGAYGLAKDALKDDPDKSSA